MVLPIVNFIFITFLLHLQAHFISNTLTWLLKDLQQLKYLSFYLFKHSEIKRIHLNIPSSQRSLCMKEKRFFLTIMLVFAMFTHKYLCCFKFSKTAFSTIKIASERLDKNLKFQWRYNKTLGSWNPFHWNSTKTTKRNK